MTPPEIGVGLVALALGIWAGYDAERWDLSITGWSMAVTLFAVAGGLIELLPGQGDASGWSLLGAVPAVVGVVLWLSARHAEAVRRRADGEGLPPGMWRWLRQRRRERRDQA